MALELDSAIAPHLQVPRTIPAKTPANYSPPFPAYSARFPESIKGIVIAIIGCQSRELQPNVLDDLLNLVHQGLKPKAWDISSAIDCKGYETKAVICYWEKKPDFLEWEKGGFGEWWSALQPGDPGWFKEIFFPPVERFETVFSDNTVPEGAAHMRNSISNPIKEHVYWGSARDRLPVAQQDHIAGEKWSPPSDKDTTGARIKVRGRDNLCVIRSGQDWSVTPPEERKLYLDTMHPVLIQGMDFLRDDGSKVGCICNRFMTTTTSFDTPDVKDRTFGLGYFQSLEHMENWSREHKTHLDIFGRFLQYAKELQNNVALRLFHEVLVLEPDQQEFEYVGCHDKTGMLAAGPDSY